jgi:hypothetical protein
MMNQIDYDNVYEKACKALERYEDLLEIFNSGNGMGDDHQKEFKILEDYLVRALTDRL